MMATNMNDGGQEDAILADDLKPDRADNFTWKVTNTSKAWRFLRIGNTTSVIKHSSISSEIPFETINELLFSFIKDGKGAELVNSVQKVSKEGSAVRHDALVYALAVCTCCENAEVKKHAYGVLGEICKESSHFLQFIDFHEKVSKSRNKTTGWGKGLRKAVQNWYFSKDPIEMAQLVTKHPRKCGWTHRDVMRLAHTVPTSEGFKVLSSYIVSGLKNTEEKYAQESDKEGMDACKKVLEYLRKVAAVRSGREVQEVVQIVKELNLPWNYVPCQLYSEPELWKGLISYLPLDVLVPQVCRLGNLDFWEEGSEEREIFIQKCGDPKAVKDSMLHPYNILMYRELFNNSKRKAKWKADIVSALTQAFDLSTSNLSPTGKRYFITIDASNSMKAHIANNDHVQCRVAAACMALCIARTEKKVVVKAFSRELAEIEINDKTKLEDIVKALDETPLGGTDCSRPIIYAKGKKLKTDVFIVFTDKETWSGKTTPCEALQQYRKAVKIPAKLIVVALNAEGISEKVVADPQDRGMMDIFGFSPSIPHIIHNFARHDF